MSGRDDRGVYDCSGAGVALPLALRRKRGDGSACGSPHIVTCEQCGVRYAARPPGSPLEENGRCRACATKGGASVVVPMRRRRRPS